MNYSSLLPTFVEAGSPSGLRKSMMKVNIRLGGQATFFDISSYSKDGKVRWVAWYYQHLDKELLKEVVIDG